jgi:hypothetical protein
MTTSIPHLCRYLAPNDAAASAMAIALMVPTLEGELGPDRVIQVEC